ncbi:MAG: hypothetical protein FWG98_10555 [Candidatus Cloacimonetes bacterium]|nr:hypothetical protein [Candidatus Cloacimonadota bacterium]
MLNELKQRMIDIQKEMQEASAKGEYARVIQLSQEIGQVQSQIFQHSAGTQQTLASLNKQAEAVKTQARDLHSRQKSAHAGGTTLNYPNGDRYVGAVLNRKPHGTGTYHSKNGNRYEGEFSGGERNGRGIFYYASGARYEGDWKNGNMHGKGKYTYAKGDVYEGDFKDNEQTGKGRFTGRGGDVYEGDFLNDKKHGQGKWTVPHMSRAQHGDCLYEGEWKEDNLHGYGVYENQTAGFRYEGFYENGVYHGKGKMTFNKKGVNTEAGDWLECDFVRSEGKGHGVYHFADGRRYEGNFKNTEMNGKGKLYYPNGDVYEVEFVDNKMQGKGVKIG